LGSKSYIQFGKNFYLFNLSFTKNTIFSDFAVNNLEQFKTQEFSAEIFSNVKFDDPKLQEDGFYQDKTTIDSKVFNENVILYFPVDRYYQPAWINVENSKLEFNSNVRKWVGKSDTNIVKSNVLHNLEKWLLDVIMDKNLYEQKVVEDQISLPDGSKIKRQTIVHQGRNTDIHNNINLLLTEIYKTKYKNIQLARIGISKKRHRTISIITRTFDGKETDVSPTFSHLSSGEIMILSLFASILREYDNLSNSTTLEIDKINGIVIIDEVDLHLHSDLSKNVLPFLIKMFKGIQFIVTSHSPFFLLGMKDTFQDSCEFVNLPTGEILGSVEDFEEVRKCYDLIDIGFEKLHFNLESVSEKWTGYTLIVKSVS
jgi:predicted ATP-binding protein involved in virulence